MIIHMDDDEYYPFTFIESNSTNRSVKVEVDDETLARWNRVMMEFEEVQSEMREAFRAVAFPSD